MYFTHMVNLGGLFLLFGFQNVSTIFASFHNLVLLHLATMKMRDPFVFPDCKVCFDQIAPTNGWIHNLVYIYIETERQRESTYIYL